MLYIVDMKVFIFVLTMFVAGYISACSRISYVNSRAFNLIRIGDSVETAINSFGKPSFRQDKNQWVPYVMNQCEDPCVERIWYENQLLLIVDEAWSLEIDKEGKIIRKSYWVST